MTGGDGEAPRALVVRRSTQADATCGAGMADAMTLDATFGRPSRLSVELEENAEDKKPKRRCTGPFAFDYRGWGAYDQARSCYAVEPV